MEEITASPPADDEISLAAIAALVLRGRWALVAMIVIGGGLGVSAARLQDPRFVASASFAAQEGSSGSQGLAGLAGQLGFSIPGSGSSDSPEFYQALLTSREVLEQVVMGEYSSPTPEDPERRGTLLDLAGGGGGSDAERLDRGIAWLRAGVITSSVGRQTGVVTLSVETPWPRVSYEIAAALLAAMQHFNLQTRRTQAQAERIFLEARVSAAHDELQAAENELQGFLQQNRQFQNSPELVFRFERLQRQVTMRQEVYSGLVEAYEQARIREVRDTPVITVLEHPVVPSQREARRTVLKGILGMILGGALGLGALFVREATRHRDDPDMAAFRQAWAETKKDLRRLLPGRSGT